MTTPTELVIAETGEFPDEELLIRLYLAENVSLHGARVLFTDEPRNPLEPPVGVVRRLPGQGLRKSGREAVRRVEVGTMGESRADSRAMNQQVENAMLAISRTAYRGVLVDLVTNSNGAAQVPYSRDVRWMPSTWDLTLRPHRGARLTVTT